MKILVISDTHGDLRNLERVLKNGEQYDMLIHCGDICGDEERVQRLAGIPFFGVSGNMDFSGILPYERIVEAGGKKIFVAHGHRLGVNFDTVELAEEALAEKADIALYGHTHVPEVHEQDGITIMNPGSLSYPRHAGRQASFGVIGIEESGSISFDLRYLE